MSQDSQIKEFTMPVREHSAKAALETQRQAPTLELLEIQRQIIEAEAAKTLLEERIDRLEKRRQAA
jgi:hypothetical protein